MATPRCAGATWVMSSSPMRMLPAVTFSSPAISRSRVDLPQPDGPTKTTSSPGATVRSTPLMTSVPPNDLRTPANSTADSPPFSLVIP